MLMATNLRLRACLTMCLNFPRFEPQVAYKTLAYKEKSVVNEKLTHVIDEIDTMEKNIEILRQIVKFLMELEKNGHIYNATHAFLKCPL